MDEANPSRLNTHNLYMHGGARRAIDAARREGQVGSYPMYLVGLAMREHRYGPAVAALLTLPDGGVLHGCARSIRRRRWLRPRVSINKTLSEDIDFLPAEELERYRRFFYQELDGFRGPCLEPGPTAAAESMFECAFLGVRFATEVGPSPMGAPAMFPSDWTDIVFYSERGVGCAVEGFAPGVDALERASLPTALKRAIASAPSDDLEWLREVAGQVSDELHPRIPSLVAEAWAIRLVSPQASVALLRSVGELVASGLGGERKGSFNAQLLALEREWAGDQALETSPSGRREAAWRHRALSRFHTLRDLGNRIHADSIVEPDELEMAHEAVRQLIETALRMNPLDRRGPT